MSIRRIKETARGALHAFMGRPAHLYLDSTTADFTAITVRHHEKFTKVGDLAGTNLSYAENHDDEETVVFWCDQLVPVVGAAASPPRGALVVLSETEGYFVDNVRPRYGQTISAEVTPASTADLAGKVAPTET